MKVTVTTTVIASNKWLRVPLWMTIRDFLSTSDVHTTFRLGTQFIDPSPWQWCRRQWISAWVWTMTSVILLWVFEDHKCSVLCHCLSVNGQMFVRTHPDHPIPRRCIMFVWDVAVLFSMWVVWTWLASESISTGSRCSTTILGLARRLRNVHVVLGQWLVCSISDSKRGPVWIRLWLCVVYLNHQCGMQIQSTSTVIQIHNRAPHQGNRWSKNNNWIKCKGYGMAVILFLVMRASSKIFTRAFRTMKITSVCDWWEISPFLPFVQWSCWPAWFCTMFLFKPCIRFGSKTWVTDVAQDLIPFRCVAIQKSLRWDSLCRLSSRVFVETLLVVHSSCWPLVSTDQRHISNHKVAAEQVVRNLVGNKVSLNWYWFKL